MFSREAVNKKQGDMSASEREKVECGELIAPGSSLQSDPTWIAGLDFHLADTFALLHFRGNGCKLWWVARVRDAVSWLDTLWQQFWAMFEINKSELWELHILLQSIALHLLEELITYQKRMKALFIRVSAPAPPSIYILKRIMARVAFLPHKIIQKALFIKYTLFTVFQSFIYTTITIENKKELRLILVCLNPRTVYKDMIHGLPNWLGLRLHPRGFYPEKQTVEEELV